MLKTASPGYRAAFRACSFHLLFFIMVPSLCVPWKSRGKALEEDLSLGLSLPDA